MYIYIYFLLYRGVDGCNYLTVGAWACNFSKTIPLISLSLLPSPSFKTFHRYQVRTTSLFATYSNVATRPFACVELRVISLSILQLYWGNIMKDILQCTIMLCHEMVKVVEIVPQIRQNTRSRGKIRDYELCVRECEHFVHKPVGNVSVVATCTCQRNLKLFEKKWMVRIPDKYDDTLQPRNQNVKCAWLSH